MARSGVSAALRLFDNQRKVLPLPTGEGRGEGEQTLLRAMTRQFEKLHLATILMPVIE